MTGAKPPQRPKKRSRFVQKHLDRLFPGTLIIEVAIQNYKVSDDHEMKGEAVTSHVGQLLIPDSPYLKINL
ncbi:hypothetical protein ACH5RR_025538 [Cinchona calisaya]|uniref:Uncharacterized protein n=1 Tax=Cinchona calisaya TaxID=153742 RepID=A0ABD2Z0F8_9GENT